MNNKRIDFLKKLSEVINTYGGNEALDFLIENETLINELSKNDEAGLSQLFDTIGNDNLSYQPLHKCSGDIELGREESKIEIYTQQINLKNCNHSRPFEKKTGFVVWVDVSDLTKAYAELQNNTSVNSEK